MATVVMIAAIRIPITRCSATRFMWCRSRSATGPITMMGDAMVITATHRVITCLHRSRAITKRTNIRSATITALCNRTLAGMAAVTITATSNSVMMPNGVENAVVVIGAMSVKVGSGSATDHPLEARYESGSPSS